MSYLDVKNSWPAIFAILALILAAIAVGIYFKWANMPLDVQPARIVSLIAPLALAAAFIERAVEIVISPWRDAEAGKLEKQLAAAKERQAQPNPPTSAADDVTNASNRLDDYRGWTQKYAFVVSLTLAMFVSIAGIRAFGPFMDISKAQSWSESQKLFFLSVDVALSTALLAGGADGIHSVVSAATSFFDAAADKAKK